MEYEQPTLSVLARLMGLDELSPSRPVQKRQRVLSDNYLQRVASIGVRENNVERNSFRLNLDEEKGYVDVFRMLRTSKRAKHKANSVRKRGVQFSSDAVVSRKPMKAKPISAEKNNFGSKVDVDLRPFTSIPANRIALLKPSLGKLESAATYFAPSAGSHKASNSEVRKHKGVLSQQIFNNLVELDKSKNQVSSMRSFRPRSRFSKEKGRKVGSISSETPQSKVMGEKISAKDSHNLTNINKKSLPVATMGARKQSLERWRTTKKYQQVELSIQRKARQEVLPVNDDEPNVNPLGTSNTDNWQDGNKTLKEQDAHENKGCDVDSFEQVSSALFIIASTALTDTMKGTQLSHEEQRMSAKDDHPVLSLHISVQQDKANTGFEEESVTSHYTSMDPESPMSLEEIYQPSPNSVLGPFYREEMIASSECFKNVSDSLHGLQMQLEILKSETSETYSEGSSIAVSSDDDIEESSVSDPEVKELIMRPFEVEESRDFSYLVDVLTQAGFHSRNPELCLDTWHSHEGPISSSVFETLEKKYGEQISWKKSGRRLLFDRINLGLMEILLPSMGVLVWKQPVARRFSSNNVQLLIEEELWVLLVSQAKEALKNTRQVLDSEKEEKLLDLVEHIQDIGRELENSLIDELLADVVKESF